MSADTDPKQTPVQTGELARTFGGMTLPLEVLQSPAGYYLGTRDEDGMPYSRESIEYWRTREQAEAALVDPSRSLWTQKPNP
ncbi:MAG: hypothetical protein NW215_13130 [Hyphomicrobiales bacterium]|nr:hypothetical protein [Hyphomicrobiales bacterium]